MSNVTSITGLNWFNENATRRYPIVDGLTARDTTNTITLPDSLIVDLKLSIPGLVSSSFNLFNFCIRELSSFGSGVVIVLAYDNTDGSINSQFADNFLTVATISVPANQSNNSVYNFFGVGDFKEAVGQIVIGDVTETINNAGNFLFTKSTTALIPTTISPTFAGVSQLRIKNGQVLSEPLTGTINLVAGENIRLQSNETNQIEISAINSTDLSEDCGCNEIDNEELPCIKSINGLTGANITLSGSSCLSVSQSGSTISFEDSCASPCCDSRELNAINSAQNQLSSEVASQMFLIQQLESRLAQLSNLADSILATGLVNP